MTAVAAHLRKPDLTAEDNAIIVLHYPRALGLLEASWTQIGGEPAFGSSSTATPARSSSTSQAATHEGQRVGPGRVQLVTGDGQPARRATSAPPGRA